MIFSSKIGEEQTSDDAEDGPPELLVRILSHIFEIHFEYFVVYSWWSYGENFGFFMESN